MCFDLEQLKIRRLKAYRVTMVHVLTPKCAEPLLKFSLGVYFHVNNDNRLTFHAAIRGGTDV